MSNYYEETMPLETDNNDYLKYYIEESVSLSQQLNNTIKRGEPFQRQAMLSKLNIIQSDEIFKPLMIYILNEFETWDKETITLIPKYIYPLFITSKEILLQSIDNDLFNMIFKKFISIISSTEEHISREYMNFFELLIKYFNSQKIKFPYEIKVEICNDIISLGMITESKLNQQLSCCLCCTVIRLINDVKNDIVQNLYNRVCYLFGSCEKQIETQLSRELEFLFPIFKQSLLENSDILSSINSYLNRDSDFSIQSCTIISIIKNLNLINYEDYKEVIEKLINKIKEIFVDENNFDKENKNIIFLELIKSLENNYKKIDVNIIKKLFEDDFISKFIFNNVEEKIIIENFDKIFFIYDKMLKELDIINIDDHQEENKKEEIFNIKFNYDELFSGIYNYYLNIEHSNGFNIKIKKIFDEKEIFNRKILYNNLMKIIPYLSDFKKNRLLFDKINFLFNSENIIFALNCFAENFNINTSIENSKTNNILYNLMHFFLKKKYEEQKPIPKPLNLKSVSPKKENYNPNHESCYVKIFNNILYNILNAFKEKSNLFNNNIHLLLCDFLQKIIKKMYKYLKPTKRELSEINNILLSYSNRIKVKSLDKIFEDIFHIYLMKLVDNEQLGNHIKNEVIKVFPYLILYSENRVTCFKYIQEHIIQSKKYFNRRYSIVYLEKCLEIFSFKMFNKIGLSDFLIQLINDENNSISANIINLIYKYHNKITKNSGIMFQNIIKNLSKINNDNKDNKLVHIKDFDIEKNRNITNILSLNLEKKTNNEHWINLENKLIKKEKDIFGDDINYGFTQFKNIVRSQTLNLNSSSLDNKYIQRKSNYFNNIINKDRNKLKRKDNVKNHNNKALTKDKYSSSLVINNNNNNKITSKTFLPLIKKKRNTCVINSLSTKIITRPSIKKLNLLNKNRQENQKLYENFPRNNNSMVLNDKTSMRSSYDFAKKGKSETKGIKSSHSIPAFYQELLNNTHSINLKNQNIFRSEKKNKDMFINTIYKSKNIKFYIENNIRSSKGIKLARNSLNGNSGRFNKIFYKINTRELDKYYLNNSLKEKGEKTNLLVKNEKI